jgi:MFS family permease
MALPFSIVNGVVWGVGIVSLPLLAGSPSRAGLTFSMINLGIAVGAVFWGHIVSKFKLGNLIFTGTLLSFFTWLAITLLKGSFLIPLAFVFGTFAASIFTYASISVTNTYPKNLWDSYIAKMQAYMTFGTVMGLLISSVYNEVAVGLPFLLLAVLLYIPIIKHNNKKAEHHKLHFSILRAKHHSSELFNGYFSSRIKGKHFNNFKNKPLLYLYLRWIFILLAPAPVYAMYPLLMQKAFQVNTSTSSLIYAFSTAVGVFLFIAAGKLAKKKSASLSLNIGVLMYLTSFILMLAGMETQIFIFGIVGFIIMILSWSFISTGMNISVVQMAAENKRGEALGVANSI